MATFQCISLQRGPLLKKKEHKPTHKVVAAANNGGNTAGKTQRQAADAG